MLRSQADAAATTAARSGEGGSSVGSHPLSRRGRVGTLGNFLTTYHYDTIWSALWLSSQPQRRPKPAVRPPPPHRRRSQTGRRHRPTPTTSPSPSIAAPSAVRRHPPAPPSGAVEKKHHMGLFDESDSDDVAGGGSHDEGGGMLEGEAEEEEEEEEEEEDPLDAYMRSLDAREGGASSSSSGATIARDGVGGGSGTAPKDDWGASPSTHPSSYVRGGGGGGGSGGGIDHGGRLDVDAEDEATSHWVETAADAAEKPKGGFANGMLDKFDGGGEGGGGGTAAAADATSGGALYGSFVRAGGGGGKGGGGTKGPAPPAAADVDRNDDESSRRDPHREVDPLERVDHRGVRYAPFRRTFHVPSDTIGGRSWRDEHDVACNPPIYDPMLGFGDLVPPPRDDDDDDDDGTAAGSSDDPVFPEELTRAIIKCGYDSPTIVQSQTLSVALSGCDALITASTGSGKTLAYIWPMIVHINDQAHIEPGIDGPIGIVLTPTRELARQVYRYAKIFVECIGGRAVEVSGGNRGTWELTKELRLGCEIVVGSPGRLIDVVRKKGTNLRRVTFLVLDEADRMLDMGFEKQVNSIMENVRPDRQTLLLSATFGKRVEKVARSWLRNPVR